jgi:hypothetical protein
VRRISSLIQPPLTYTAIYEKQLIKLSQGKIVEEAKIEYADGHQDECSLRQGERGVVRGTKKRSTFQTAKYPHD